MAIRAGISVAACQAVLTGGMILLIWRLADGATAGAAAFGGGLAMINALLLSWRLRSSRPLPQPIPMAVERMILALAAFAVALGPLRFSPLPLLATFAVAQLGHVAGCRACLFMGAEPCP